MDPADDTVAMSGAALAELIRTNQPCLVLTGAGASTESGLPDFRSASGIWAQYDPYEVAVWPVAGLPDATLAHGGKLAILNREATSYDARANLVVRAPRGRCSSA